MLGERVGWRRWAAVLVGFLGVLVMLDPGDGMIAWPALVALAGAVEATGVVGNALTLLVTPLLLPWGYGRRRGRPTSCFRPVPGSSPAAPSCCSPGRSAPPRPPSSRRSSTAR